MREATVPVAMLFATLGLLLGFVPRRVALTGGAAALIAAYGGVHLLTPLYPLEAALIPCWVTIGVVSVFIFWTRFLTTPLTVALSITAGIVGGFTSASSGNPLGIYAASLAIVIAVPSSLAVTRGYAIAPRVVTGWLLAVTMLGAILPHVIPHPGYVPDHRE